MILHLTSFLLIGSFVKLADQAYDESLFPKGPVVALAPFTGTLLALLVMSNSNCALLLLSIAVGCLLSGKVDNLVFYVLFCFLVIPSYFGIRDHLMRIDLGLLAVLSTCAFVDEIGNSWADRSTDTDNRILRLFFLYRFTMKIGVLGAAIFSSLLFRYFFVFLMFDMGYITVDLLPRVFPRIYSRLLFGKTYLK